MDINHMNGKRVVKRIKEELRSTFEISRVVSFRKALITLVGKIGIQIMVRNGHRERKWIKRSLLKKHKVMNTYFEKKFSEFMKGYDDNPVIPEQSPEFSECVWICWWQGIDKAPVVVQKCIESIKKNAGNHKVIVITEENVNEFLCYPDWLEQKYKKGIITRTHLSDYLRLELLATYGGMWLDSTFLCTQSLEQYFSLPVWSIKRPDYRHSSVACGYFANYSFGCDSKNRMVFAVIRDFLLQYWRMYDFMIDYLFLDYLIVLVQKNNDYVSKMIQNIPANNLMCDELLPILGEIYDEDVWQSLKQETSLFKLSWKAFFPSEIEGERTFYGKLIQDELW